MIRFLSISPSFIDINFKEYIYRSFDRTDKNNNLVCKISIKCLKNRELYWVYNKHEEPLHKVNAMAQFQNLRDFLGWLIQSNFIVLPNTPLHIL